MNKIINLTKNEIIKQYKKTSILVITIMILAFSFISPLAVKYIDNKIDDGGHYDFMLKNVENNLDGLKIKNNTDKVQKVVWEAEKEKYTLLNDFNKNNLKWIEEESDNFAEYEMFYNVAQLLLDGVTKEEIRSNIYNVDTTNLEAILNATKGELSKVKEYYNEKVKESKDIIQKNDYFSYNNKLINEINSNIKNIEKELKTENIDKDYAKNQKEQLTNYKNDLKVLNFYKDNNLVNDELSWQSKLLNELNYAQKELQYEPVSEKEFNNNPSYSSQYKMTYDEYKASFEINKQNLQDKVNKYWYALENDIPELGYTKDARSSVEKLYNVIILIAVLFVAVIGSGIVANEFSKGTIRLLLIRPASRAKILISKLLALLLIGFGLTAVCMLLLALSSGIFFGFSTLFTPVLEVAKEGIIEGSYFMYMLPKLLVSSTSILFIGTLSFMLSIVTKNTAISVALPLILLFGGDLVTNLLVSANQKWVANTFIPYMNMPMLAISNVSEMLNSQSGVILNYNLGAIWLVGLSVVGTIIGFLNFTKSDVTN